MTTPALELTDGYKVDHRSQYPKGTNLVRSNWTARGSRVAGVDRIVFFGLQYFIQRYLIKEFNKFFNSPKELVVEDYMTRIKCYLGPNAITYDHINALHDLGYLPIKIEAAKEGELIPLRTPMLFIENTLSEFFWLTNYLETLMSVTLWLPCTSATTAYYLRKLVSDAAAKTGGDHEFTYWQCHDFSFRGMSSVESALLSGMAHLLSFKGTDTIPAISALEEYYGQSRGGSVPATEHSVMCMGQEQGEVETFHRMITEVYPAGIVSIVSDTWDYWKVIGEYLVALKATIMAREGKVVIRPDSGDPVKIVCGDPDAAVGSLQYKGTVEALWDLFGGTINPMGYKVLDPHIGLIYGDGINHERCKKILDLLEAKGFCSTNIVFGIGSFTYQYVTRDTFGFAMKATYGQINNLPVHIFKDPKTDDGTKRSAKGLIEILRDPLTNQISGFMDQIPPAKFSISGSGYDTVFLDGVHTKKTNFTDIIVRLHGVNF